MANKMLTVFNARNNKYALAEKVNDDLYTLIFLNGEQKEVQKNTFVKWYKEVSQEDFEKAKLAEGSFAPSETGTKTDVPASTLTPEAKKAEAEAKKAEQLKVKEAKAEEAKKAREAKLAEKANGTSQEDKDKAKAIADQAKADAKVISDKAKADKAAISSKAKEDAKELKAKEKAEKAEAKALADANKTAGKAKGHNKLFFTQFVDLLNSKAEGYSKAGARDRNYMSFPAGASGFKYKFFYTNKKLVASLYIFGPQIVTTTLFNKLQESATEIQALLPFSIEWKAPEDDKNRRIVTVIEGDDAVLIEQGVDALIKFKEVFTPFIESIIK
jgi:hypothetical protein